jgi:hypothetical protein
VNRTYGAHKNEVFRFFTAFFERNGTVRIVTGLASRLKKKRFPAVRKSGNHFRLLGNRESGTKPGNGQEFALGRARNPTTSRQIAQDGQKPLKKYIGIFYA